MPLHIAKAARAQQAVKTTAQTARSQERCQAQREGCLKAGQPDQMLATLPWKSD